VQVAGPSFVLFLVDRGLSTPVIKGYMPHWISGSFEWPNLGNPGFHGFEEGLIESFGYLRLAHPKSHYGIKIVGHKWQIIHGRIE